MRIILAPMEGLVDAPIRETLTKVGGIDRCVTEFIRVTHGMLPPRIFYKYAPELHNGALTEVGTPVAVQLLGSNADMMGRHGAKAAELGAGQVDFRAFADELRDQNYDGWIVVEQDVLPGMGDPKACAQHNRAYLKGLSL